MEPLRLNDLRMELCKVPGLWQFDLLARRDFERYAGDMGVRVLSGDTTYKLWRVGLLRADLIRSRAPLSLPGIRLVTERDDELIYCDERVVVVHQKGLGAAFDGLAAADESLEIDFHPFRLFVLHQIFRAFRSTTTETQFLSYPDGVINLARKHVEFLHRLTKDEKFSARVERWNVISETAIVAEPTEYLKVFNQVRYRHPYTEDTLAIAADEYWAKLRTYLLLDTSLGDLQKIRGDLCCEAEIIDANKMFHVLIRLMSTHERQKLRGDIGVAMQFLTMSEILRRGLERAHSRQMPEEDEMGFGQWMEGARLSIYGTERIADATWELRRDFLTTMGLDSGTKVRCYVEGGTEYGALTSALGNIGGAEFINLRGSVVERGGKGLQFVASLANDIKSGVFSVILVDADRADVVRALTKAAVQDKLFGQFFVSSPDFEFGNFTISELIDVYLGLCDTQLADLPSKEEFLRLLEGVKTATLFFARLRSIALDQVQKGPTWGASLMKHALQNPDLPADHEDAPHVRPVVEAARLLLNARRSGYARSRRKLRVDPETGGLVDL